MGGWQTPRDTAGLEARGEALQSFKIFKKQTKNKFGQSEDKLSLEKHESRAFYKTKVAAFSTIATKINTQESKELQSLFKENGQKRVMFLPQVRMFSNVFHPHFDLFGVLQY